MSASAGIRRELLEFVDRMVPLRPPAVRRVFVPEPRPDPTRDAEFGLVELEDGSAGLYYAWLGESQRGMAARFEPAALAGMDACALARLYAEPDEASRSLGLAAVNTLTAHLFSRAGYLPPAAADSFGGLTLDTADHLGMVGNFPSLVRQARERGARVTVVERKPHMVREEPGLRITLEPTALDGCNKVVMTAATLINDSLDEMLGYCRSAREIVVVGPTAGCIPDPLFARGVTRVGGTRISASGLAIERLRGGAKLADAAQRYAIDPAAYPGLAALLARASGPP